MTLEELEAQYPMPQFTPMTAAQTRTALAGIATSIQQNFAGQEEGEPVDQSGIESYNGITTLPYTAPAPAPAAPLPYFPPPAPSPYIPPPTVAQTGMETNGIVATPTILAPAALIPIGIMTLGVVRMLFSRFGVTALKWLAKWGSVGFLLGLIGSTLDDSTPLKGGKAARHKRYSIGHNPRVRTVAKVARHVKRILKRHEKVINEFLPKRKATYGIPPAKALSAIERAAIKG